MSRIAVFPGTFDPITKGHEDIVNRALPLFDKIIVAVGVNAAKQTMFTLEQRKKWIADTFAHSDKVEVKDYRGLTADFCVKENAGFILRGNGLFALAYNDVWAVDNVGKPIADAILDAVQDPETAASLIASGIQLALKLGEGIMRLPYSIASGFVSGFVGEVGRLLGIDLSNFGHGTITLNEYDIAHLAALTEPGREGIRSQSTPTMGEDMGGPHAGRGPVWIGSGQQPELFWPNEAGTFYPASRFGGGDAVNNWTVNLYGIQDMKQALDELEREARRRNRRLTVGMGGAG